MDPSPAQQPPKEVLEEVFKYLSPEDLVSCGQTCRRWREAAKEERLWRDFKIDYNKYGGVQKGDFGNKDWHTYAQTFARFLKFVPCLNFLKILGPVKPGIRKILTASRFSVRGVAFDGSKAYSLRFLKKHSGELECVELWNATGEAAKAAAQLPHVKKLSLCYKKGIDTDPEDDWMILSSLGPSTSSWGGGGARGRMSKPDEPYVFKDGELPSLRHAQLLRVPEPSARALLQLRGPALDTLDTDLVRMLLPMLGKLGRLERLILRLGWRDHCPGLKAGLEKALPDLPGLESVVVIFSPRRRHMQQSPSPAYGGFWPFFAFGMMDCEYDYDEEEEEMEAPVPEVCGCIAQKKLLEPVSPLMSVLCMLCDGDAVSPYQEENMAQFESNFRPTPGFKRRRMN